MFLLLNMARRVRFSIAQPITIVGWYDLPPSHSVPLRPSLIRTPRYLSSICLIALLATAAGPLQLHPTDEFIWSQAFWYGLWAAILYFIIATLNVVTVYGALTGHYPLDFQLTSSQRTLMLQTIMFLVYTLLGALVFSNLEGWNYLDSVYWANVTLFTIGFGDFIPETTAGRALLIPYALIGIISVGLVIGSIRSLALERASRRVDARMVEKKRLRVVKQMSEQGKDSILRPIRPCDNKDEDEEDVRLERSGTGLSEFERRKAEFNLMRLIQHQAMVRRRWVATIVSTLPWLVLWLVGSLVFVRFEAPYQQWSYFDGIYFTFVSLTTVGYGDITPVSNGGRSFFVFWALLALPTMTVLISNASDTVVKFVRNATLQLGKITILPGEHGFETDVQYALHKLSCGLLFSRKFSVHRAISRGEARVEDEDERGSSESGGEEDVKFPEPTSPAEYHYLLIHAISTISNEMQTTPEKRYSFQEWAYYLRLLGEDERSPSTHRMARLKWHGPHLHTPHVHPHPLSPRSHAHKHEQQQQHPPTDGQPHVSRRKSFFLRPPKDTTLKRAPRFEDVEEEEEAIGEKWSWVGGLSPLMGGAESAWILERLTKRLKKELENVKNNG